MRKIKGRIIIVLAMLLCVAGLLLIWLITSAGQVLYSYRDGSSAGYGPSFTVLNPFRDQTAEIKAVDLLRELKGGRCEELRTRLPQIADYCARELQHPIEDWTLSDIAPTEQGITYFFRINRRGSSGYGSAAWITVGPAMSAAQVLEVDFIY